MDSIYNNNNIRHGDGTARPGNIIYISNVLCKSVCVCVHATIAKIREESPLRDF